MNACGSLFLLFSFILKAYSVGDLLVPLLPSLLCL